MPVGGKRPGAGRPAGGTNRKTRERQELVDRAAKEGITPIEVMLQTMREAWNADPRDTATAMTAARDAAPYVHPKLAPIDAKTGETAKFVIIDPCH